MAFNKTAGIGSILGAALVAGGTAYYLSKNGMRVRRTIDNEFALDRTTELARVSPEELVTGAAVTVALAGIALWGYRRDWSWMKDKVTGIGRNMGSGMQETEATLDIDVPVSVAYNQWTQFEEFPRFMPNIQEVKQIDDSHLHWKATVAGKTKEWDSEITQQIPDQLIEWRSTGGVKNGGIVTFDKIREGKTRVKLRLWWEPQSSDERIGGMLGGMKMYAKGNLNLFASMLEKRGKETGAWRGEIAPQH